MEIRQRVGRANGSRRIRTEVRIWHAGTEVSGLLIIIDVTPDARHYVHSYSRLLTDLFVVKGLK